MQIVGGRGRSPTAAQWVHPVSVPLSWVLPFSQVHLVKEEKATSESSYKECDWEIQALAGNQSKEQEILLCLLFAFSLWSLIISWQLLCLRSFWTTGHMGKWSQLQFSALVVQVPSDCYQWSMPGICWYQFESGDLLQTEGGKVRTEIHHTWVFCPPILPLLKWAEAYCCVQAGKVYWRPKSMMEGRRQYVAFLLLILGAWLTLLFFLPFMVCGLQNIEKFNFCTPQSFAEAGGHLPYKVQE